VENTELFDTSLLGSAEIDRLRSLDIQGLDKSPVEKFIYCGTQGDAGHTVNQLLSGIGEGSMASALFRFYVVADIYLTAKTVMAGIGFSGEEFAEVVGDSNAFIRQFREESSVRRYLVDLLEKCIELRNDRADSGKSIICKAKRYISEHYCDSDLTLANAAASVNISATYFSYLFRKETGETFSGYLTNYRIEKAKALLSCSTQRVVQIASAVGYNDYHYFAGIFKKMSGLTPSEFRKKSRSR
jgi:two-component system, response regulator YesN